MKILHVCLFSSFTENMGYQENILSETHARDGHEVTIISNCSIFKDGVLCPTNSVDKIINYNIRLIRVHFMFSKFGLISRKIGKVNNMYNLLNEIDPDIIIYHGAQGIELLTIAQYVKKKRVRFYIDTHADYNNSSSKIINLVYHRAVQRTILNKILTKVSKIFYISIESGIFARNELGIPESKLEFMPLGGFPVVPESKSSIRAKIRNIYNISSDTIIFIHTGKFNSDKKTSEIVRAFNSCNNQNIKLILAGVFENEMDKKDLNTMSSDERILFLGWKNIEELRELIIASDCYLQPGTQSASLQLAICCGIAVMIYPYKSHEPYLVNNGYFVSDEASIKKNIDFLSNNKEILEKMGEASLKIANEILDYNKIAKIFYN